MWTSDQSNKLSALWPPSGNMSMPVIWRDRYSWCVGEYSWVRGQVGVCVCVCVRVTYCMYFLSQVGHVLSGLDQFFEEVEPEVEGISGEESDTQSFMKLMNIFNKVRGTIH